MYLESLFSNALILWTVQIECSILYDLSFGGLGYPE